MVVRAVRYEPVSLLFGENPCFATRTAKSRRRLTDPSDEKRCWQSGFEQPPHCVQAQITANLRAHIRELEDAEQGPSGAPLRESHTNQIQQSADQSMMDKDGLRSDSLREGLKVKGRSRREAAARSAEAEKGSRRRRNDILPSLSDRPLSR